MILQLLHAFCADDLFKLLRFIFLPPKKKNKKHVYYGQMMEYYWSFSPSFFSKDQGFTSLMRTSVSTFKLTHGDLNPQILDRDVVGRRAMKGGDCCGKVSMSMVIDGNCLCTICIHMLCACMFIHHTEDFMEGSLEVTLPTIWTNGKAEVGRVTEEKPRRSKKWEDQRRMICGGSKCRLAKRRVRSQLARWEMKNCTPLWREARFQVKMHKARHVRTTFEVEMSKKCTPVVARSTFPSQNV